MIVKWIKKTKKNNTVGLLIADVDINNQIQFGYSLCRKTDKFDKAVAYEIAIGRLTKKKIINCPYSITNEFIDFAERAARYFKTSKLPNIIFED